ncbi:hypothetical protein DRE_07577 [Drechslerella stenobrocha 248]|uniref:DNA recombination and repair protein Rad51-like C-terminal domain-containing protein n=1 Tax=Drechslerella stenobrocha 248 TaxID=1043628 RepID=W7HHT8_9PEZI|nr:hypothetical protein DRE_07577 [Drechslerella stenobrocha 248]
MTNPPLPTSGSDLLSQAKLKLAAARQSRLPALKTSSPSVDAAIGGVHHGRITSLHCEAGGYAYGTLAPSFLLTRDGASQVAYVDTTGAFSPVSLLQVVMLRMQQGRESGGQSLAADVQVPVRDRAAQMLDRVQYMRAFDFDGVVEAVAEVAAGIRSEDGEQDRGRAGDGTADIQNEDAPVTGVEDEEEDSTRELDAGCEGEDNNDSKIPAQQATDPTAAAGDTVEQLSDHDGPLVRDVVPDSQADSDEEILWPLPPLPKHDHGKRKKQKQKEHGQGIVQQVPDAKDTNEATDGEHPELPPSQLEEDASPAAIPENTAKTVGLLIVDSMSRPTEGLLEANEVTGHAALTRLSRTFRSLARDRDMAVLLLSSPVLPPMGKVREQKDIYARHMSVFAGIQPTYGLAHTINNSVDLSLLASRYLTDGAAARRRWSAGQETLVVEVISERHGDAAGRWGAFTVKDGTELVDIW